MIFEKVLDLPPSPMQRARARLTNRIVRLSNRIGRPSVNHGSLDLSKADIVHGRGQLPRKGPPLLPNWLVTWLTALLPLKRPRIQNELQQGEGTGRSDEV